MSDSKDQLKTRRNWLKSQIEELKLNHLSTECGDFPMIGESIGSQYNYEYQSLLNQYTDELLKIEIEIKNDEYKYIHI